MSKKSFKDNPALQFMSRTEEPIREDAKGAGEQGAAITEKPVEFQQAREAREIPISFRAIPMASFEAKSKRFNMLIRPSVYTSLREMAVKRGTSVNDLINTIVENYIEVNGK